MKNPMEAANRNIKDDLSGDHMEFTGHSDYSETSKESSRKIIQETKGLLDRHDIVGQSLSNGDIWIQNVDKTPEQNKIETKSLLEPLGQSCVLAFQANGGEIQIFHEDWIADPSVDHPIEPTTKELFELASQFTEDVSLGETMKISSDMVMVHTHNREKWYKKGFNLSTQDEMYNKDGKKNHRSTMEHEVENGKLRVYTT